ncbi:MAG: hypothetical protein RJA70_2659 [Pseudomonadota bacterium]|jgi:isopentenyl-diphosphate delta-isomerase
MSDIQSRKTDHLDLAAKGDVAFRHKTTLFDCVDLVHDALPELALDEVDLSCTVLGKPLRAPLLIAAMTGGTDRAGEINRTLARVAERRGYAFGLGSQRPMLTRPETRTSFDVRSAAPAVLLLGNLGVVQASQMTTAEVAALVRAVQADALCIHLNPAMEVVQPEGDRDFRGGLATLTRLQRELPVPVIAKETGCGISAAAAGRLRAAGIEHVDVSGAGGTSWVAVETQRASEGQRQLGELFWDWGIPTAASVLATAPQGFQTVIATGGMHNGLQAAKALALGAHLVGIARPVLQAYERGGETEADRFLAQVELELRTALLLTGSKNLKQLRAAPRRVHGELRDWLTVWQAE